MREWRPKSAGDRELQYDHNDKRGHMILTAKVTDESPPLIDKFHKRIYVGFAS